MITAVAVNIMIVYLFGFKLARKMRKTEKWYFIIPVVMAFTATVVLLALGQFGFDSVGNRCWIKPGDSSIVLGAWLIPYSLTLLYSAAVVVATAAMVIRQARELMPETKPSSTRTSPTKRVGSGKRSSTHGSLKIRQEVARNVTRIALYPIVAVTMMTWTVANDFVIWQKTFSDALAITADVCSALQSALLLAVYMNDPAISRAWTEIKDDMVEWYLESAFDFVEEEEHEDSAPSTFVLLQRWIVRHLFVGRERLAEAAMSSEHVFAMPKRLEDAKQKRAEDLWLQMPVPSFQESVRARKMSSAVAIPPPVRTKAAPQIMQPRPVRSSLDAFEQARRRSSKGLAMPTTVGFLGIPSLPSRDSRLLSVVTLGDGVVLGVDQEEEIETGIGGAHREWLWETLALL